MDGDLLQKVSNLGPSELLLLAGYCAGLAETSPAQLNTVGTLATAHEASKDSSLKALILYASQTGNAQAIAESLQESLDSSGYNTALESTLDIKLAKLNDYALIVVIASTHGEGEPPDDAIDFYEAVLSKKAPSLNGVKHAVLGLGDSSYEFFCQTAKDFDSALSSLGSVPLIERLDCDVDYQQEAVSWITQLVAAIAELQPPALTTPALAENIIQFPYSKEKPFSATVSIIQKLTAPGSIKDTYHLEIDLAGSGLSYRPGDALGVWADNDQILVGEILSQLSIDPQASVTFKEEECSIENLLRQKLEITLLNKGLIRELATLSGSQKLFDIADTGYSEYIRNHQLIDVLKLANITLEAQQLVEIIKPLKPRLYSISSSIDENPEEVHITLNHLENENQEGIRYGQASHFLTRQLNEGDKVNVYVDHNKNFKLPTSDKAVIMIGPGTGIAPFRSFLQQRDGAQAKGRNWLFFGNPNFNTDFLYQTELQKYLKSGLLTQLDVAFSRDQQKKIYVQDRLRQNAEQVWQWLEQGACFYVCGDMSRMAKEVELVLLQIIEQQGNKTQDQAKDYLKQLKQQARYQRDVY
ncbi:MAG TPA: assimilatory sulfite reductase (NADPH) flavoprotein subunit [Porticoccaceae bacterium]|nr:assimilatory sulfite reductase (NADPH) flavoprotein subunit [Porticoccaceae bacterium]HIK80142.1 assimilatory sulfite reductase (NADPH) flavoprotein subunit [Porticoccaceae bacterium]